MKKRLIIFLILAAGLQAIAQPDGRPFVIKSGIHSGLNLPFYKALDYLIEDDIYAFDISIGFPSYGKDHWERLYNYPTTGMGYSLWTLGNDEVLGRAHAIYGYMSIPVLKKSGNFSLDFLAATGAAYLPYRFDIEGNHLNRAIGSNFNIYIRLGIQNRIRINNKAAVLLEAGTTHFSNGKTRSPNYGINAGSVSVGFSYLFNEKYGVVKEPEIPQIKKEYIHSLVWSAGSKTYDNLLNNRYLSTSITFNIERYVRHAGKAGLGAVAFYDGSISEALAAEKDRADEGLSKLVRLGLHASYAYRYKNMMAGLQIGHYLYSKYKVLTHIYNRISVQYLFTENIFGSIAIKSHWGKADCLEYGIGYTW